MRDRSLNLLPIFISEFQQKLALVKQGVPRTARFPEAPNKIKVAIGMRRVGKTYFMLQKIQQLLDEGVPVNQILYLNLEVPLRQKFGPIVSKNI